MKRQSSFIRLLSVFLACVLTVGFLPAEALEGGGGDAGGGVEERVFYEVRFALPEGEEAEEDENPVILPETVTLKAGTPLSTITLPEKFGYVFLGWYYDPQLLEKVGTQDELERNLTLYPSFGKADDATAVFAVDYVSAQNVGEKEGIRILAWGLSEEEIREAVSLRNVYDTDGRMDYDLTLLPPQTELLIADSQLRAAAEEILSRHGAGTLREPHAEALAAAGLSPDELRAAVRYWAPDELETDTYEKAVTICALRTLGLEPDASEEETALRLAELFEEDPALPLALQEAVDAIPGMDESDPDYLTCLVRLAAAHLDGTESGRAARSGITISPFASRTSTTWV